MIKQLTQWCIAFVIGFLIVNILLFAYERPVGWYDTPNGVSIAVRNPNTLLVHGTEGYALSRVDANGFLNTGTELAEDYILIMGASHTQGKEIPIEKRFSEIVNTCFSDGQTGSMAAYNIASDGQFLPFQIQHFNAAVSAYPDASYYVIETPATAFSPDDLRDSLDQVVYDESSSAVHFQNMSTKTKIKYLIKEYFPLLSMIKTQIETMNAKSSGGTAEIDLQKYNDVINEALALIRSETNKPIVFVYHPSVRIEADGTLTIVHEDTWESFLEACENNGIDVIDSSADFLANYDRNHTVPYGFSNTVLSSGHLNSVGHQLLADEIIEYVNDKEGMK